MIRLVLGSLIVALLVVGGYWWQQYAVQKGQSAIVVPHHDIVADTRAAYFKSVAETIDPDTIILVSPDHFDHASAPIVVADMTWETSVGTITPNKTLIEGLDVPINNEPFLSEHGITSLIQDIKTYFPDSTLVPLLLNRAATYSEVVTITTQLHELCPNCLLVSSVDFSHSSDAMAADLHDRLSLRGLYAADSELLYRNAEVDSPESLVALTVWAQLSGKRRFELFSHTNSVFLQQRSTGEVTSHIIGGYERGPMIQSDDVLTFMAAGDVSLSRGVHTQIAQGTDVLGSIGRRFFWGVDTALVNLEGYFTDHVDETGWEQEPPLLAISSNYIRVLKALQVSVVNLANNHSQDGGHAGKEYTEQLLTEHNISYIGDDSDSAVASVEIQRVGDVSVAFIGVYTHTPFANLSETIEALSKDGHHVVVYAHWGEEYSLIANNVQRTMARDWIDAGADVVLGSHPHVVQDFDVYKGRPIIYSLGNFMFDQSFNETVQTGAVVGGIFTADSVSLFAVPMHTYIVPRVLDETSYTSYVARWTEPWSAYAQTDGYFTFKLQ